MNLRVLVCDDELMARKRVTRLCGELGAEVVAECASGDEVLARLADEEIDVLIIDIHMPGMTGIEAVLALPEDRPYVIFATAHPEHAVAAFELGATDYVLKPVDAKRLATALARAQAQLERGLAQDANTANTANDANDARHPALARLALETKAGIALIATDDVTHAVFDGQLVTVHTRDRAILSGATLQDLEARLPGDHFERVHRRAIVNLLHVEQLEPNGAGGYFARVAGGKVVEVSRQAARKLRRRLGIA